MAGGVAYEVAEDQAAFESAEEDAEVINIQWAGDSSSSIFGRVTLPANSAQNATENLNQDLVVHNGTNNENSKNEVRNSATINQPMPELSELVSLRRPRDIIHGTGSGLKAIFTGVFFGVASVVILPIAGYKGGKEKASESGKSEGWGGAKGCFKGAALGIVACPLAVLCGAVGGVVQIVRGAIHTPSAVINVSRGKRWNKETRRWETDYYNLVEESAAIESTEEKSKTNEKGEENENSHEKSGENIPKKSSEKVIRPPNKVKDPFYYEILEIETNATSSEIKRAYYRCSLKYHPDKNDSPDAQEKFQAVSEAYQVLSDESRRKLYDKNGKDAATHNLEKIDPNIFFSVLFGSRKFEVFVGKLQLAAQMEEGFNSINEDDEDDDEMGGFAKILSNKESGTQFDEKMKTVQKHREIRCATHLAKLLDKFAGASENDEFHKIEKFKEFWEKEVEKKYAGNHHDVEMLYVIGWAYQNRAQSYLSSFNSWYYNMKDKSHSLSSKATAGKSMVNSYLQVRKIMKDVDSGKKNLEKLKNEKENEKIKNSENSNENGQEEIFEEVYNQNQQNENIEVGDSVKLLNLQNSVDLNNQIGVVHSFDPQRQRFLIELHSVPKHLKAIKRVNLQKASERDIEESLKNNGAKFAGDDFNFNENSQNGMTEAEKEEIEMQRKAMEGVFWIF